MNVWIAATQLPYDTYNNVGEFAHCRQMGNAMKTINELAEMNVKWKQKGWSGQRFELRSESGDVIGTLKITGIWRTVVRVEALGNRWEFERFGLFRPHLVIRAAMTGDEVARFSLTNKTLTFRDGRQFVWRSSNFWGTKWVWTTSEGAPVVGFQTTGAFTLGSDIHIEEGAEDKGGLSLLVFLGWYLVILNYQQGAIAAIAAS